MRAEVGINSHPFLIQDCLLFACTLRKSLGSRPSLNMFSSQVLQIRTRRLFRAPFHAIHLLGVRYIRRLLHIFFASSRVHRRLRPKKGSNILPTRRKSVQKKLKRSRCNCYDIIAPILASRVKLRFLSQRRGRQPNSAITTS